MIIWIDAQISPFLAGWITRTFGITTHAVRDLGMHDASDFAIFEAAKKADATVLTKDMDFMHLLAQHGPPPRILWITCGNTSNVALKEVLKSSLETAVALLASGEPIVEITGTLD